MAPEKQSNLPVTPVNVPKEEADRTSKQYDKVMDAINNSLTTSPDDFRLAVTRDRIDKAKEDLRKKNTKEAFDALQQELRDASGWLNLTDGQEPTPPFNVPQVDLPRVQEPGLARRFETDKDEETNDDFARRFGQAQIPEILEAMNISEKQIARIGQIDLLDKILASEIASIDIGRTKGEWLKQAVTELAPSTAARRALLENASKELKDLPLLIVNNPNKTLNELLSSVIHQALAKCSPDWQRQSGQTRDSMGNPMGTYFKEGFIDGDGNFTAKDPVDTADMQQQYLTLISILRIQKDYNGAQRLIEDQLLAPYLEKKMEEMTNKSSGAPEPGTKAFFDQWENPTDLMKAKSAESLRIEASLEATEMKNKLQNEWMNPSAEMLAKGGVALTAEQVEAYRDFLSDIFFDHKMKKEAGKLLNPEDFKDNKAAAAVYDQYRHMLDPKDETCILADETWDFIIDEIAINAPLMFVGGLAATAVVGGLSLAARGAITSVRLASLAKKAGLAVKLVEKGGKLVERVVTRGALGTSLHLGGLGVLVGAGGFTFNGVYEGLQGESCLKEGWVTNAFITGATLSVFKLTGEGAKILDTFLQKSITKFPDKSFRRVMQTALTHGTLQTSVMLAMGAAQHGFAYGNFDNYKFGEELFRTLVTVGALNVVGVGAGKCIEIGGKRFTPERRAAAAEQRAERKAERSAAKAEPLPISKMRGVEVHPETGAIKVTGVANGFLLRLRLIKEGYKIEKNAKGFEATDAKGTKLSIETSSEIKALEQRLTAAGKQLNDLLSRPNVPKAKVEAALAKLMLIAAPLIAALTPAEVQAWTFKGAKDSVVGLFESGGNAIGVGVDTTTRGFDFLSNLPTYVDKGLMIAVVLGTAMEWSNLRKAWNLTLSPVLRAPLARFFPNSPRFRSVEQSAQDLVARPGTAPGDVMTQDLGAALLSGGPVRGGRTIRANIIDDIESRLLRSERTKPLARQLATASRALLDYMARVTTDPTRWDQRRFDRLYNAVSNVIQRLSSLEQLGEPESLNLKDAAHLVAFIVLIAMAYDWLKTGPLFAGKGSSPVTPPTFDTPSQGGTVTPPTFNTPSGGTAPVQQPNPRQGLPPLTGSGQAPSTGRSATPPPAPSQAPALAPLPTPTPTRRNVSVPD
jgi:hypothetical protein